MEQFDGGIEERVLVDSKAGPPISETQVDGTVRLQNYYKELLNKKESELVAVNGIVVRNSESLRPGVLQTYLDATILKARTLGELVKQADILDMKLIQHGLVENASQVLGSRGTFQLPLLKYRYASQLYDSLDIPQSISVIDVVSQLELLPLKKFMVRTGTNIGNGEGDGYLQFQLRNIFGGGEQVKFDVTKGTKTHSSYLVNYAQPLNPWWVWDSVVFKNSRQMGNRNSIETLLRGFRTCLRSGFLESSAINHELYYDAELRSNKMSSLDTCDTLLYQAGDNFKTSLGHVMVLDKRDSPLCASNGSLIRWCNELAIGKFWKSQLELSRARSWFLDDWLTMSGTVKTGYILNFHPNTNPLNICDKFQNGGANDVRSFQVMGLGPKDLYDSIGGDAFVSYGLSIFTRLPFKKIAHSNFRLHWFFNGGKLINHNNTSLQDVIKDLSKQHSTSIGFGLVLRHPVARFELNFTLPVTCHSGDSVRKGFQYGIGISFL
ncbi:SAM50 (YNL026W) [Zygosaccharomyces parabailii]|nr:SAM50 (YNL026W) [Zygosaccharomyces parabailii]CDH08474.1 related to Sorting assembly machinery 50 kDa subunit [Zygosaccharomyces bailii ISA1307]